ncbi:MAG: type II secretion system F family protein, partial [Coriobacteriia bacterium]|nr:type II secretion system F family protein [Coriobacteriia bacterium]
VRENIGAAAPKGVRDRIRQQLLLAGDPGGMDVGRFLGIKALSAVCVTGLVLAVAVVSRASALTWLAALVVCVASYWLPDAWLSSAVSRRQHQLRIELPDMLDMLTISVEAGLGFDQAIAKIVRMSHGPLAHEFARMLQEIQAGSSRGDALKRVTGRTDVPELNTFATAVVQAEQLGIPIANVLRVQSKEMRLTRRQRAEEQAQKTPVKIVFPLVLCILPATLIVILGPAVVSIARALF